MSDNPQTAGLIQYAVSSLLLLIVYFIPTCIAFGRGHYRRWQIFVGNLLLGWTFFVWCYCVILALSPGARETD